MSNKVYVVGVGLTKFEKPGRREGWDYPEMARESGTAALADAGITYDQVQQAYVGYCTGDSCSGHRAVYGLGLWIEPGWCRTSRSGRRQHRRLPSRPQPRRRSPQTRRGLL